MPGFIVGKGIPRLRMEMSDMGKDQRYFEPFCGVPYSSLMVVLDTIKVCVEFCNYHAKILRSAPNYL
jgi:hypothetical protein